MKDGKDIIFVYGSFFWKICYIYYYDVINLWWKMLVSMSYSEVIRMVWDLKFLFLDIVKNCV